MNALVRMSSRMVLARQYFMLTLALATLLVVTISSWELWRYFKLNEQQISQLNARVYNIYQPSIASKLKEQKYQNLQSILDGIVEFDAIEFAQIVDTYTSWQAGQKPVNTAADLQLQLYYVEAIDHVELGELSLYYEQSGGFAELFPKWLSLFSSNAIKALLVLAVSLVFFNILVSRYVVAIDHHLRNLNPEKGVQLLRYRARRLVKGRNEFDSVIATINILNYRLVESVRELRLHGAELEQRVAERTQALERANERALRNERLSAIGQLVGNVSHELRNPMGTIQASLALLQRGGSVNDSLQRSAIKRIERNIERCDKLVRELLNYSQLPADPVVWIALDPAVQSIVDEHLLGLDSTCELTFAADGGASVWIAPEQLTRLLGNLVDNAVDAVSSQRDGRIHVATSFENDCAVLSVADNGLGISQDMRERIFEPMFSTKSFGFGFGLSVVMQVVQSSEADIQIENNNPGTKFVVRFNRDASAALNPSGLSNQSRKPVSDPSV